MELVSYVAPYPKLKNSCWPFTSTVFFSVFFFAAYSSTYNHFKDQHEVTNISKKPVLINFSQLHLRMEFFFSFFQVAHCCDSKKLNK